MEDPPAPRRARREHRPSGVQVECLLLCDAAQVANGKLFVLGGGWDILYLSRPGADATVGIALKLTAPWAEVTQPLQLELHVTRSDGSPDPDPLKAEMRVREGPQPRGPRVQFLAPIVARLPAPDTGEYAVRVFVGGRQLAETRFLVALREQSQAAE